MCDTTSLRIFVVSVNGYYILVCYKFYNIPASAKKSFWDFTHLSFFVKIFLPADSGLVI